jgi:hypothetical protein
MISIKLFDIFVCAFGYVFMAFVMYAIESLFSVIYLTKTPTLKRYIITYITMILIICFPYIMIGIIVYGIYNILYHPISNYLKSQ